MMTTFRRLAVLMGLATPQVGAYPAYNVHTANGSRLHLVGSIHMGTRDMSPLPPALLKEIENASALIVEVDITKPISFNTPDDYPSLQQRLSSSQYQQLAERCHSLGLSLQSIAHKPGWHAALMLQAMQANQNGLQSENGIDYQAIQAAYRMGIPVIELEGAERQMQLLDRIPDNGIPLLQDSLAHWQDNSDMMKIMIDWWLEAKPKQKNLTLPYGMSGDLYNLLISSRNALWAQWLHSRPKGKYVVVVGALHLYGENNLPDLLNTSK
ncbi:TraB/GumN family protein [Budvicia diplopodorum]|uniref:TraB/GumN family protein n=1 Tax=Budvicia diplopodorum TaxID=1119056 RepID=UPI00135863EA|nr:TraB/GumN family protein [Budvicia diplopodorum]